ncbi:hypothetical protein B296_00030841 [Ensete ventricosum]|uniref:Uncharacterized protein n=1 Tax=Ensete ventricosum TaxID=4639 RepID=A0A426XM39_ENSVE|nr:hypothetical protein B296_00030841 [Ensete ventricosum]
MDLKMGNRARFAAVVISEVTLHLLGRRQRGGGAASHGQPLYRSGHPRLGRSQGQPTRGDRPQRDSRKGAGCRVARASGGRQRPARKGRLPAVCLQGGDR